MLKKNLFIIFLSFLISSCSQEEAIEVPFEEALAVLVPGSGSYSRKISTQNPQAQTFFDQGLRFAWGFYFPESIASYQEASRLDPDHPMPFWGMAHAWDQIPIHVMQECQMTRKVRD